MAVKNLLEMVASQAKTGREIKGLVVKVVPDNERFEVTEYDPEAKRVVISQILPEDSTETPETLTITKDNELVAHYFYNPNERPAPEASIIEENGKKYLILDNEKLIGMGNIKGLTVLGGMDGQVLLSVEGKSEGSVDLMGYDVQMDTFYDVACSYDPSIEMITIDKEHTYIIENIIANEKIFDDNGKELLDDNGECVTKQVFKAAYLYKVESKRENDSVRLSVLDDDSYDIDDDDYDEEDELVSEFNAPIMGIRTVDQAGRSDIVVVTKSLEGNIRLSLYIDNDGRLGERVGSFTIKDENAKVFLGGTTEKPPVVTIKDEGVMLIRTQRGLLIVDDTEVVKAFEGYDYFCGVFGSKDDDDRQVSTWCYANADRSLVKRFTSVNTDRGTLFTVL